MKEETLLTSPASFVRMSLAPNFNMSLSKAQGPPKPIHEPSPMSVGREGVYWEKPKSNIG
ncbi:hypothetical protein MTR_1g055215 [Medicago truncatula]|uniref:Uncharacterized protein n=1 Tax=Medicago truncatula TaxID=3880 RepID=A0A072VJ78_MEDTR|nr:hypothetical protein MTR_1g055215 [Medicago truncatula]